MTAYDLLTCTDARKPLQRKRFWRPSPGPKWTPGAQDVRLVAQSGAATAIQEGVL